MERRLPSREVDRRVRELVARARDEYGLAEGCDGATACGRLALAIAEGALPAGTDGLLAGRTIVLSDRVTWPPRREFTVFHEITHYLLDEDGELIEDFTDTYRKDPAAYKRELERCCNVGAAEFLMPQRGVYEAIQAEGLSIALVERIVARHGVSIVAAAQQLASCAPADSYVILAVDGAASWVPRPHAGLCIEYAFIAPDTKYPLARFHRLERDHLLSMAWEERRAMADTTYIPFSSGKRKSCFGEVRLLGSRVIGFLGPHRPVGEDQLALPLLFA